MVRNSKIKFVLAIISLICLWGCNLSDYVKKIGDNYEYYHEGFSYKVITHVNNHVNDVEIPRSIIAYDYDDHFILAAQVDIIEKERLVEEDEEVINPKKINFWLIEIEGDKLHGPLTLDEYLYKRKELNIPSELKLKIEL